MVVLQQRLLVVTGVQKTPYYLRLRLTVLDIFLLLTVALVYFLVSGEPGYLLLEERTWCLIQPVGAGAHQPKEKKKTRKQIKTVICADAPSLLPEF